MTSSIKRRPTKSKRRSPSAKTQKKNARYYELAERTNKPTRLVSTIPNDLLAKAFIQRRGRALRSDPSMPDDVREVINLLALLISAAQLAQRDSKRSKYWKNNRTVKRLIKHGSIALRLILGRLDGGLKQLAEQEIISDDEAKAQFEVAKEEYKLAQLPIPERKSKIVDADKAGSASLKTTIRHFSSPSSKYGPYVLAWLNKARDIVEHRASVSSCYAEGI